MRLGGPVFGQHTDPQTWVEAIRGAGFRAAVWPLAVEADNSDVNAYLSAAAQADILIAEVGAWSNPLSPDETTRKLAVEKCKMSLALADKTGARCCVNISGSRGEQWDGPAAANFSEETFQMIVEATREIIDTVRPTRTFYTLEPMPWMYPDSPESYLRLLEAVDRPAFAVHLDPVNIITSPRCYFDNAAFLKECFSKLGPHIKSCHAKDILLKGSLTVHLEEVRPGLGNLDYRTFLRELAKLDETMPVLIEHLPDERETHLAAEYIRSIAQSEGLKL
jgi:sugar phosphate isomerase/epimerase